MAVVNILFSVASALAGSPSDPTIDQDETEGARETGGNSGGVQYSEKSPDHFVYPQYLFS